jgi:hypothetical protein
MSNLIPNLSSSEGHACPSACSGAEAVGVRQLNILTDANVSEAAGVCSPHASGAAVSVDSPRPGNRRMRIDDAEPVRSPIDDWRIALHEAGHTVIGRVLGEDVGGCTIEPGPDYGGKTWGPLGNSSRLSSTDECPDLCEKLAGVMPGPGEPRSAAAEIFAHVHVRVVDLCAGTASETLLHPDCEPWVAHSDIRQARALASMICSSECAIDAYLMFGLAEAKALIVRHRAAVLGIARALMIHKTLDAKQIHEIIASAAERARRVDWKLVEINAAQFPAEPTTVSRYLIS